MLRYSTLIFTITTVSIVAFAESQVDAFQVFSNSRPGASANRSNSRTATGTISGGNRHGLAGGLSQHQWSYNSPGGQFRSNSYRRSTSSFGSGRQSPVFHNYNPGTLNRAGTTTYHSGGVRIQRRSGIASFSGPGYYDPYVPGYNGVAVGGIMVGGGRGHYGGNYGGHYGGNYGGHYGGNYYSHHHGAGPIFYVDPFAGPTFSPYAAGYPWVPGGQVPFGIYAPPIVVPPMNQGLNVNVVPGVSGPLSGGVNNGGVNNGGVNNGGVNNGGVNNGGVNNGGVNNGGVNNGGVNSGGVNSGGVNSGFVESGAAPDAMFQPVNPNAEINPAPIAVDEAHVNDEFPVKGPPTDAVESSSVSRIRGLRYQTSGDSYYRQSDFASAEALYRSSTREAPDRIAPWLRLAFSQVAVQKYADAVRSLKAALKRNDDPSAAWISSEVLAGKQSSDRSLLAEDQLYDWLKQRPNSSDRLLLVAAWSEFRGSSSAARELLQMARQAGLNEALAANLEAVMTDRHQPDAARADDQPKAVKHGAVTEESAGIDSFTDADIKLLPQAGSDNSTPEQPLQVPGRVESSR